MTERDHGEAEPVEVFPGGDLDLRVGADSCYKCSTCDTNCPVAAVDDSFPGPKFQGPEQWRLKRKSDKTIDSSIMNCSNCMRCDAACPTDVPLSQMHNEARGEYVDEHMSRLSRIYWRNKLLANYRTVARVASLTPRLSNFVANNRLVKWCNHHLFGITSEREVPRFATQTFRSWWNARGGAETSRERAREARMRRGEAEATKRVAYFHGCYANYNTPEVAKALVRVYEHFGYELVVPAQDCSGTPMFANGMLGDARAAAETNVDSLGALVEDGYDVICSCTSCSMSIRQEYPELFDFDGVEEVSVQTFESLEYLRIHEDLRGELGESEDGAEGEVEEEVIETDEAVFAYHAPCHARNQGLDRQTLELFEGVDTIDVVDVGKSCSGISGTYGWKAEKYDNSMAIGREMFEEMEASPGDRGVTECPTCAMQMAHGTGYEIVHPIQLLESLLVERDDEVDEEEDEEEDEEDEEDEYDGEDDAAR